MVTDATSGLPTLVLDVMLGRLARWLRTAGFDASLLTGTDVRSGLAAAAAQGRILVTRRPRLTYDGPRVIAVEADSWREQFAAVVVALGLRRSSLTTMVRCNRCNTPLRDASRDEVRHLVPPFVYATHKVYRFCDSCRRPYWVGTHVGRIERELDAIFVYQQTTCQGCGRGLPARTPRFRGSLRTEAVDEPLAITDEDLAQDHEAAIDELLGRIAGMSGRDLEDGVAAALDFVLCPGCHGSLLGLVRRFLNTPPDGDFHDEDDDPGA